MDALKKIYSPLLGTTGELIYPRFDPGAEGYGGFMGILSGAIFPSTTVSVCCFCETHFMCLLCTRQDWYRFAVYNDSSYTLDNFSVPDIEFANTINPGGIATWNGNLSEFQNRGGKLITYHGRSDPVCPPSS